MNSLYPLMAKREEREEHEEQDPNLKLFIFPSTSQVAASSSHLAFATCFSSTATQHDHQRMDLHHHQNQGEKTIDDGSRTDIDHQEQRLNEDQIKKRDNGSATKYWMSSKMRLVQKMMKVGGGGGGNSEQHKAATRNNNNEGRSSCSSNGVRVCSDCNTTTTPLWRSGPQGPKSLCNACGIRQRKARRAMAEAANGGVVVASGKELHKEKKSRLSCHGDDDYDDEVKKKGNKNMGEKCLESGSDGRNDGVSFDGHSFTLRLSKNGSAFGRVFPRDEEEAAILLMELSCGLVHTC